MKDKKRRFQTPIIGIETLDDISIMYNLIGDYSVVIKCENPVIEYAADVEAYYNFHELFVNIIKMLGKDYCIQKQDIFSKKRYEIDNKETDFLSYSYFNHFIGRTYTDVETYLVITNELPKGRMFAYDKKKFDIFLKNVVKVLDLLHNKKLKARLLDEREIDDYLRKYLTLNFKDEVTKLNNFNVKDEFIKVGQKTIQSISLVDIDEINFPPTIRPFKNVAIGKGYPVDIMAFLNDVPNTDTIIYNQVITIPDQSAELAKLEAKKKRHSSMPDPANQMSVDDIDNVMKDIARDGQYLVYTNYNVIIMSDSETDLSKAVNFIEGSMFDNGIITSKQCYNQLELFTCSTPGNSTTFKDYDKFLTTSDTAVCLLYKERPQRTEKSPFLTYFTDRRGLPIGIDVSGKEGEEKLTNNSNFFVLGPSGSGKSFYVNSKVRQWVLADTDIVLVDTGHSYIGLCNYYHGKYITYTEENPITMNPFRITKEEFNEEKIDFLKSLIIMLWKGSDGEVNQVEDTLMTNIVTLYYNTYWNPQNVALSDNEKDNIRNTMTKKWEGEEKHPANLQTREDLEKAIDYEIYNTERDRKENHLVVESLSFNSFFEFALKAIQQSVEKDRIQFNIDDFRFVLNKFYKGGKYEKILNDEFDSTLFEEKFIVFEIDSIKENKVLFPIVTLIIMDVFLQKMRLKRNRKALIIEEAWKAIASPTMANYILYLYKTVRKFWGMAMVVTQELEDIISNATVKNSIINNSDIVCLLDQTKFRDNYEEIADLLSLNEVEQKKIFTINKLPNKDGRSRFNEVYIKRGSEGQVYGVEVSPYEYFTFTTERIEKDAMSFYQMVYGDYRKSLETFIADMRLSKIGQGEWVRLVFETLKNLPKNLFKELEHEYPDSLYPYIKKVQTNKN